MYQEKPVVETDYKNGFVAGTFDHFHIGHQFLLWSAYRMSQNLTIIVARDQSVQDIKGFLPCGTERERQKRIEEEFVGTNVQVKLGRTDKNFVKTLETQNPEVVFVGYDQKFPQVLTKGPWDLIRIEAYFPEIFKSSFFRKNGRIAR